jgi:hypothetical protein
MIELGHPYFFLANLFNKAGAIFHLSKYIYTADSIIDEREFIKVSAKEFTLEWLESTLQSLEKDQELALHSQVFMNGRMLHIPMIDFALESSISPVTLSRMRYFIPNRVMLNLALFESGRSFHAYSTTLISPKQWIDFMGRLLLINERGSQEIIDTRWIGHRLVGGFSSLRWSNNTGLYLRMPQRHHIVKS